MKAIYTIMFTMLFAAFGLVGCGPEKADLSTMNLNATTASQNAEKNLAYWAASKFAGQKVASKCDIDSDISALLQVDGDRVSSPVGDLFVTCHLTVDGVKQPELSVFTAASSSIVLTKDERSQKTVYTNRAETVKIYIEENGNVLKKI